MKVIAIINSDGSFPESYKYLVECTGKELNIIGNANTKAAYKFMVGYELGVDNLLSMWKDVTTNFQYNYTEVVKHIERINKSLSLLRENIPAKLIR